MECQTDVVANFFVVRWRAFTQEACAHVVAEIGRLHTSYKERIPYLGIMPADMARTDAAGRKAVELLMKGIEEHCELAVVAVEARGFAGAAMRSMLTGIMLVSGRSRRIKFVDTVEAAMDLLGPLHLPEPEAMRKAIAQVGGSWRS